MARRIYTEEFRIEAVKQVTNNGYSIKDMLSDPGNTTLVFMG
jgi:transposase-like protein